MTELYTRNRKEWVPSVSVGKDFKDALRATSASTGHAMRVLVGFIVRGLFEAPDFPREAELDDYIPEMDYYYPPSGWGTCDGKVMDVPLGIELIDTIRLWCRAGPTHRAGNGARKFAPSSVVGALFRAAIKGELRCKREYPESVRESVALAYKEEEIT